MVGSPAFVIGGTLIPGAVGGAWKGEGTTLVGPRRKQLGSAEDFRRRRSLHAPFDDPKPGERDGGYRVEHGPDAIDWSRADPLDKEERRFRVQAENGRVRFELKKHYPSEKEAHSAVEADHIPNWEFVVGLTRGPSAFTLRFDHSELHSSIAMNKMWVPKIKARLVHLFSPQSSSPPRASGTARLARNIIRRRAVGGEFLAAMSREGSAAQCGDP